MGKKSKNNFAKRGLGRLPKGLPVRGGGGKVGDVNPFEATKRQQRVKHAVHNKNIPATATSQKKSALAQALALKQREAAVKAALKSSKSANILLDKRIGEYDKQMTPEQQKMARLVKERSRLSKRTSKYNLDGDDDGDHEAGAVLTHEGKPVDKLTAADHVILSDDEDGGDLGAVDTDMHFGGGVFGLKQKANPYGPGNAEVPTLDQIYEQRKNDLDDMILRRKIVKAEKLKTKQDQESTFEVMDHNFEELSKLLNFRDKEQEIRDEIERKRKGKLSEEEAAMEEWNKEMKQFQTLERKVKATDRTKSVEEMAKEEAEHLHELETRRLARMSGDFEDDDFSDISVEGETKGNKKKYNKKKEEKGGSTNNNEVIDNASDEEDAEDGFVTRMTPDGLYKIDKDGKVIGKVEDESDDDEDDDDEEENDAKASESPIDPIAVGTRVSASYHANEQFDGHEAWYDGVITAVHEDEDGAAVKYDITYDDGDVEEDVEHRHVKLIGEAIKEETKKGKEKKEVDPLLKEKRKKAKEKARKEIPYVFEVPTTLDALHDVIGIHATTGADASLIIQRIHRANSVRLDRRNIEKMQNFYDVLLRRFVAVGDAIYTSGDGGPDLRRFQQLDALTETMYLMSQDAPDCASAVWGRRLGFFQNAHAKRLRDAEFEFEDGEDGFRTAWPSTGIFLTLRALGHIFPVTDLRHSVVTPAMLLIAQVISLTPIMSLYDLVIGTLCSGLLIEYTLEAKRVVPEALAFLSGIIRLFSTDVAKQEEVLFPLPAFGAAATEGRFKSLRSRVCKSDGDDTPQLSLEKVVIEADSMPTALLSTALRLVDIVSTKLAGSMNGAERECLWDLSNSLLLLDDDKQSKKSRGLPKIIQKQIATTASALSHACQLDQSKRTPLCRRSGPAKKEQVIKSYAPRMEDPEKFSMSKDKGKSATQAAADRTRRELKRDHKAVARELRLDATLIEKERREEKEKKDSAARAKRQKAFAWMETEQATLNQQVAQGGGLLQGGGIGAARMKAKSAKLGVKKGGKFR